MTVPAGVPGTSRPALDAELNSPPDETPASMAARHWVHQFARTLKTCRLYEQNGNATVDRFLADLADALKHFHEDHGPLILKFSSNDVTYEGASLYLARSRDDNLALPFFRDGIRGLTLNAGTSRDQLEALISAIIHVTAIGQTDDDLVTLLWESHLASIDIDYVAAESDVSTGADVDDDDPMPWPDADETEEQIVEAEEDSSNEPAEPRSDDWTIKELTLEAEAGFAELESLAPAEVRRFHAEYQAEHEVPITTTAIALVQAYLAAGGDGSPDGDIGRFLPRVLRESLATGRWLEAAEAVSLLEQHGHHHWSKETFVQELMQPISVTGVSARLDDQDSESILDFTELAQTLGDTEIDILVSALAQCQSRRTRRVLIEAVIVRCRDNPERLAPWLADPRWFVVRNVAHILGVMGGAEVPGLLEGVIRHPEPRVRYEVVAALSNLPARAGRPLLLGMIDQSDTRTFCSVLSALSLGPDAELARRMFLLMQRPDFERRPGAEKRAVYHAIATMAGDDLVPELEAELISGNWFSLGRDEHQQAIANCLAGIGTLQSVEALRRGSQSRRPMVRRACEVALMGWAPRE